MKALRECMESKKSKQIRMTNVKILKRMHHYTEQVMETNDKEIGKLRIELFTFSDDDNEEHHNQTHGFTEIDQID